MVERDAIVKRNSEKWPRLKIFKNFLKTASNTRYYFYPKKWTTDYRKITSIKCNVINVWFYTAISPSKIYTILPTLDTSYSNHCKMKIFINLITVVSFNSLEKSCTSGTCHFDSCQYELSSRRLDGVRIFGKFWESLPSELSMYLCGNMGIHWIRLEGCRLYLTHLM